MGNDWITFWALFPILAAIICMYFLPFGMGPFPVPMGGFLTALIAMMVWRVPVQQIVAGAFQGLFLYGEIIFLIFSAILLIQTMKQSSSLATIGSDFKRISADRRIQAILIAWLLGSGIEGLLGFSATGAAIALLLVGMNFPPTCAVLMGIMGPMPASVFGSMGAPLFLGVERGFQDPSLLAQLTGAGISLDEYLKLIAARVGLLQGIAGAFMPTMMCFALTRFYGKKQSWTEGLDILPFALFSGIAFAAPFAFAAAHLGPELAPLVGCVIGMVVVITAIKSGFLVPPIAWNFRPKKSWPKDWAESKLESSPVPMPSWKAWMPFIVLLLLLAAVRFPFSPLSAFLKMDGLEWKNILGTSVSIHSRYFLLPSLCLLASAFICMMFYRLSHERIGFVFNSWAVPFVVRTSRYAPFTMMMACIYLNTGVNQAGLPSMAQVLADAIARLPGSNIWGAFATPFLGAVGAFFSGNHVFSNINLSAFQFNFGQNIAGAGAFFVALQMSGASAHNLIASVHFLEGACEAVGINGWESPTGRKAAVPMLIYLTLVGVVGVVTISFFFTNN
ncbi:MAG: L-lactate permease [bacterium]